MVNFQRESQPGEDYHPGWDSLWKFTISVDCCGNGQFAGSLILHLLK
jgi:hypothetical protein